MKYTVKNTAYMGLTETVKDMYVSNVEWSFHFHTELLSEARVWDTFDEAANYLEDNGINDHKIVLVKDEDVFEARLRGT